MRYRPLLECATLACSLLLLLACVRPVVAADGAAVAGFPPDEALRLGERMYREGLLPSGQPMKAVVKGDIEVSGRMTTCSNCHQRGGMGSLEGGVVTPPTTGAKLFAPLTGQRDIPGAIMKRSMFTSPPRPAYTDETLARVLRTGIDPAGRRLSDTMPRYHLDEDGARIMVHYLKQLSSTHSPGVNAGEIRFATIIAGEVPAGDRDALILPLEAFLRDEWNSQLSVLGSPWNHRWYSTGVQPAPETYRKASLDVWELKGPRESWNSQLETYYRTRPVFAILGGIAPGTWEPVHDFCETHRIPCLFPDTDLPVVSSDNRYTLYFSKGVYQEGEAAAKYLSRVIDLPPGKQLVQVYRDTDHGKALGRGFAETWTKLGDSPLSNRIVAAGEKVDAPFWEKLAASHPNAVLLVWLDPSDLTGIDALGKGENRPSSLFVSATLLAGVYGAIPDAIRDVTFVTWPTRLPEEGEYPRSIVSSWLKMKKIPVTNLSASSKVYVLTRLLSFVLRDMGTDYYRDFFLDLVDDGADQTTSSLVYPTLSFGPGQRYASKGCYIVTLGKGAAPKIVRQSDWVAY